MEVVIGTVAGTLAAVICIALYAKGCRDGARVRSEKREAEAQEEPSGTEKELERKFDAILDYDPYGTDAKEREQGESS